jgi:hypothetical protein
MDEIQTRVYCPECGTEVEVILGKEQIPERIIRIAEEADLPGLGKIIAYRGGKKCFCGKIVRATCVVGTFSGK